VIDPRDERRKLNRDFSFLQIPQQQLTAWGLKPAEKELNSPARFRQSLQELRAAQTLVPPLFFSGPHENPDFTQGYDPHRLMAERFSWGRYDEDRRGMYTSALFQGSGEVRSLHVGVDLGAPAGTPIFSPLDAKIWGIADRSELGDYGGVVVLESQVAGERIWILMGHLSRYRAVKTGDQIVGGQLIGWLGERHENGGWNAHLHFQISRLEPLDVDLPGAVFPRDRDVALAVFPDPEPWLERVRCF
jgi:murein DD-endopeptidase MepM/ murein hydrolase activator NlpD